MKSLYTEKEIDLLVDFFGNIDNFQKHDSDFYLRHYGSGILFQYLI